MIVIDAQNKTVGRVATQAASFLMGKDAASYARNLAPERQVKIVNASKLSINPHKARTTTHTRYSGFPGGLKFETSAHIIATKGHAELLRKAIRGMLPSNKLRPKMLKRLLIED